MFARANECSLSPIEREKTFLLIIEADNHARAYLKQTLNSIGFSNIAEAPTHIQGLRKFEERPFTHVLFDARPTDMSASDFVRQVLKVDP